jgi:hypothetical protein
MKNYTVNPVMTEDNDFVWCVVEEPTDQIIMVFEFEDEAAEYCHFLNVGGAFEGFTPSFILREVVAPIELNYNQKFEAIFQ